MSTLLDRQIAVNRILTLTSSHASAIEDPIRAKTLNILYKKALSAEQISNELRKTGHKKALTTIRHHIEILKVAGLIEIVKIEETRGAITKFYGTSTKLLGYDKPHDFDSLYSSMIQNTSSKIEKLLKNLIIKTASKTKNKKIKNHKAYSQYLLMEIMNRAMTNVLENGNSYNLK